VSRHVVHTLIPSEQRTKKNEPHFPEIRY